MSKSVLENPRTWISAGVFFTATLLALSPFDLQISHALANQKNGLGQFIRIYGTMPYVPVYVVCLVFLCVRSFRKVYPVAAAASAALLVQAIGHTWLLTSFCKWLWGRTRYYNLYPDFSNYMSIFDFDSGGAGVSFTSGHVATSLVTLPIVLVLAGRGKIKAARMLLLANAGWGAFMAYARILAGAHFATDVLASAALACFFVPLSAALGERLLKRLDRPRPAENSEPEKKTHTKDLKLSRR